MRMSTPVLIIGESGSGKSTAIRTLNPKETFIINVLGKPLPFKGWRHSYKEPVVTQKEDNKKSICNLYSTDKSEKIISCIKKIESERKEVKQIIIDDFQYVMANEFMRRAIERGYDKFTEIAKNSWSIINEASVCRSDLIIYFLTHSDVDMYGKTKCKTIGKMLDEKITIEGMFTIVLNSIVEDGNHYFITKSVDKFNSKSPIDMFKDIKIPNDLQFVSDTINDYFNEDIQQ